VVFRTDKKCSKTGKTNRRAETMRGGRRSTSFKSGVSGNPGGRPKRPQTIEARRIIIDVKALARECAPQAISTLEAIMLDPKAPPAARIGAATAILDRAYGRPGQAVEVTFKPWDLSKLNDAQLDQLDQLLTIVGPKSEQGLLPAPSPREGEMRD
jgi:hypothetical protein